MDHDDLAYRCGRVETLLDIVKAVLCKEKCLSEYDRKMLLTLLNAPVEEEPPEMTLEEPVRPPDWDEERGLI